MMCIFISSYLSPIFLNGATNKATSLIAGMESLGYITEKEVIEASSPQPIFIDNNGTLIYP